MKETHRKILEFVTSYMLGHGYPPTTREIADGVGYTSTSTIFNHLRDMRAAGLIHYIDECPRTITVPGYRYIHIQEGRKERGGNAGQHDAGRDTSIHEVV